MVQPEDSERARYNPRIENLTRYGICDWAEAILEARRQGQPADEYIPESAEWGDASGHRRYELHREDKYPHPGSPPNPVYYLKFYLVPGSDEFVGYVYDAGAYHTAKCNSDWQDVRDGRNSADYGREMLRHLRTVFPNVSPDRSTAAPTLINALLKEIHAQEFNRWDKTRFWLQRLARVFLRPPN